MSFLFLQHKRSESWRPGIELSSDDSHIGQLLQYMLGVHLQELDKKKGKRVLPILGLYMDGLVVSVFMVMCCSTSCIVFISGAISSK